MFGVHHPHHLEVWFKRLPFYCAGYLKLAVCRRLEGPQLLFLVWDWFISTLMRTMQVHGMVAMKVLHVFTDSVRSTLRRYIHTYITFMYLFMHVLISKQWGGLKNHFTWFDSDPQTHLRVMCIGTWGGQTSSYQSGEMHMQKHHENPMNTLITGLTVSTSSMGWKSWNWFKFNGRTLCSFPFNIDIVKPHLSPVVFPFNDHLVQGECQCLCQCLAAKALL